jgi:hypothetical protein
MIYNKCRTVVDRAAEDAQIFAKCKCALKDLLSMASPYFDFSKPPSLLFDQAAGSLRT